MTERLRWETKMNTLIVNFATIYFYFIICSFIGWLLEVSFWSIKTKSFINAGFLYGPFIPIYGFGALFIYLLSSVLSLVAIPVQLIIYTLVATILEYLTAFLLETIFSLKLWDYSDQQFNFQGRICLKFSFFWFLLITFDVLFFQPLTLALIKRINIYILCGLVLSFTIYVVVDMLVSGELYVRFRKIIKSVTTLPQFNFASVQNIKKQISSLLTPLKRLPDLNKELKNNIPKFATSFVDNLRNQVSKLLNTNKIIEEKDVDYQKDKKFTEICSDIINYPKYQELKKIYHHKNNSIYDHTLKVAWMSYSIGKKMNLRVKELTKGALLHDFFLYDWRSERPKSGKLHAFGHPQEALDNSLKYFAPLTSIEKDIILKHMWPLTVIPPRYIESFIVSIADKIVATQEYLEKN